MANQAAAAAIEAAFESGQQHHRQGEFPQAMHAYQQVLQLDAKHLGALHHVGIVAFQVGNFDMAAGFFRSALAVDPDHAAAHGDLGNALKEMHQLEDAVRCYDRALALHAADPNVHFNRGLALLALQRPADALESFEQVLALDANDDQAWDNRAVTLHQLKQNASALESAEQALNLNPNNLVAHSNRGDILVTLERLDEAELAYSQALELAPDYAHAHCKLGCLLLSRGKHEDALRSLGQAIALAPDLLEAYQQRAIALQDLKQMEAAQADRKTALQLQRLHIEHYRALGQQLQNADRPAPAARMYAAILSQDDSDADVWQLHARMLNAAGQRDAAADSIARALALKPDNVGYLLSQGIILRANRRYAEAQQCFERAIQLAPSHAAGYSNLGNLLAHVGKVDQAFANYQRALALDPGNAQAHTSLGLLSLQQGDFERGWREHEWRWQVTGLHSKREFPQPAWDGKTSLAGKTILLYAEQGLGDTLQFCRYAGVAAARGARVILEVQPPLVDLLGSLDGVERIVAKGQALPPFDCHLALMSMPAACDTRPDTIPAATPYLTPPPARVARWRTLLGAPSRPRVGLVWRGNPFHTNDHNRSMPLALLARLVSDRHEFISLQKEHAPEDLPLLDTLAIRKVDRWLDDFSDTAALCELLDVVITVDTSVAHLAGALGKPVWLLLQTPSEWRWMTQSRTTPWYPSATLYRQAQLDDWASVIVAVAADLAQLDAQPRRCG